MNLLSKIREKIHGKPAEQSAGSADEQIAQLQQLPDSEKIKVLDYLKSLNNLHEPAN